MKKFLQMLACLFTAVAMTACGDDDPVTPIDPPTPPQDDLIELAAPELKAGEVTTNTIMVTWSAVANAAGYSYKLNDGEELTTANTALFFENLQPETSYTLKVKALSSDVEKYTESPWALLTVVTLAEEKPEEKPEFDGVREGFYHVPTYWDEETQVIQEYNTFEVKLYRENIYYISNLLNYGFPWEAIYDKETRELVVTGNMIYENEAGEVITENIFNKICDIYSPTQSGIGVWIGCIPRGVDENNPESTGADPFRMGVNREGYLYLCKSYLVDAMFELKMAAGSTEAAYQIEGIGNFINYRSMIMANIMIAQGQAPEE